MMIRFQSIDKRFHRGQSQEVYALRNLTFEVDGGEWVTVIGTNGAGKSTLLNMLAGVHTPDSGVIEIDGNVVTTWPEHRRARLIGRVFQNPLDGTAGSLTVEQNLALALRRGQAPSLRQGVTAQRREQFRSELAHLALGLEDRLAVPVQLLSGGQRQALTLLMATLNRPPVLLLDEHTAALDPGAATQIERLTAQIIGQGQLTTLMVTHNMQQALRCGSRTLMLHHGQIVLDLRSPERDTLTVSDLVALFASTRCEPLTDDEILLT